MSTAFQLGLVAVMILGLVGAGCGGIRQAGESPARTKVAEVAATVASEAEETPATELEATETPEAAEATPEPEATASEGEEEEIEEPLNNLLKLAPLHVTSSFVQKSGDEVANKSRYEADIDASGNQHMFFYDQNDQKTEMYLVDRTLYIGTEEGQFLGVGDIEEDAGFAFLAIYGGAYLLGFNNMEEAKRVGSETVSGFDCDKYEFKYDLAGLGLSGLAADVQGAEWEYKAFAWIEKTTKAVVRGQVDWKSKSADSDVVETFHSEFEATKGTVDKIEPPENVLNVEG